MSIEIREAALDGRTVQTLLGLSADWEAEGSCRGYGKNEYGDLAGNRVFLAEEGGEITGYLFGHRATAKKTDSVMEEGTGYFEIEELYVKPAYRSKGVGSALFRYAEEAVRGEAKYLLLNAASRNYQAALRFYIGELGMEFWSARLFKKL